MKTRMGFVLGLVLMGTAMTAWAAAVKVTDAAAPSELDASIQQVLQKKAVQVSVGDNHQLQIWLRESLPLEKKPESPAKALAAIKTTTLLGAVKVTGEFRDYKDNEIPPGIYTLRFSLQPEDGDHLGTSEYPYFAVLTTPGNDPKLDGLATYKALTKASGKEVPSGHPLIISLRPATTGGAPTIQEPAPDHQTVRLTLTAKPAEGDAAPLSFELVFKGKGKT